MSKTKIAYLSIVSLICILFSLFFPLIHVLEISGTKDNGDIIVRRIKEGSNFSLSFIHSAQPSMVKDNFRIDRDHNIALASTIFSDHGAGLPYDTSGVGTFEILDKGQFRISNMNKMLPKINLTIGKESMNMLEFEEKHINLSQIYGDTTLVIRTRKYSPAIFFWRMLNAR